MKLVQVVYYTSLEGAIHIMVSGNGTIYGLQGTKYNAFICNTLLLGDKIVKMTKHSQTSETFQSREENTHTNRQMYK